MDGLKVATCTYYRSLGTTDVVIERARGSPKSLEVNHWDHVCHGVHQTAFMAVNDYFFI